MMMVSNPDFLNDKKNNGNDYNPNNHDSKTRIVKINNEVNNDNINDSNTCISMVRRHCAFRS